MGAADSKPVQELAEITMRNSANDMNYLVRYVQAIGNPEMKPMLVALSKLYMQLLSSVPKVEPILQSEQERFMYLADDKNLLKLFRVMVNATESGGSNVTHPIGGDMVAVMRGMRQHEANAMYYHYKYAQGVLFQAAFMHCISQLSGMLMEHVSAAMKSRENVFQSVFKQLLAITKPLASDKDALSMQDLDGIKGIHDSLMDTKKIFAARSKLEKAHMTKLGDAVKGMLLSDVDGQLANEMGNIVPMLQGKGVMSGYVIKADGKGVTPIKNVIPKKWHPISAINKPGSVNNYGDDEDDQKETQRRLQKIQDLAKLDSDEVVLDALLMAMDKQSNNNKKGKKKDSKDSKKKTTKKNRKSTWA
jgi:hypothetical protein